MARRLLNIPKEETPQPLGNLCQCSGTTQHSSAAWCSEGDPVLPLVPMASCPGTGQYWEEPGCVLLAHSIQVFMDIDGIPVSLCFCSLISPSALSLYSRCCKLNL